MGNTVVWKPAETQLLAPTTSYQLLAEAGLPPGVINLVTGLPGEVASVRALTTGDSPACTSPARRRVPPSVAGDGREPRQLPVVPDCRRDWGKFRHRAPEKMTRATGPAPIRAPEYQGQVKRVLAASRAYVLHAVDNGLRGLVAAATTDDLRRLPTSATSAARSCARSTSSPGAGPHQEPRRCFRCSPVGRDDSEGFFVRRRSWSMCRPNHEANDRYFGPILCLRLRTRTSRRPWPRPRARPRMRIGRDLLVTDRRSHRAPTRWYAASNIYFPTISPRVPSLDSNHSAAHAPVAPSSGH